MCFVQAYCAILYLKPRMQVIIQGQKVKNQLISKSLAYVCKDQYKPNFLVSFSAERLVLKQAFRSICVSVHLSMCMSVPHCKKKQLLNYSAFSVNYTCFFLYF